MVYLIHFQEKYYHAQHYVGYSNHSVSLENRIGEHRNGNGSPLLRAVTEAGIPWQVVRTWPKRGRTFERYLKNQKNSWRFCPICSPAAWQTNGRKD